jgi:NADP-dependent 3-hydroxy acid dehydrogenase YdfG
MDRLVGRAAIITGGAGSIAMATARAFIGEGAQVLLAGLSEPVLRAGGRGRTGRAGAWKVTEVTDSAQFKAAVNPAGATLAVDGGMSS